MTNWCDINGLVPKWLVNVASASVPKGWAKTYEMGCQTWMHKTGYKPIIHATSVTAGGLDADNRV